jgi:GSH-dependent disulfide-bond oxidoreductase
MIDLYTWQTSNGQRAAILLEECGYAYRVHKVDLTKGEQRAPEFLKLNPVGAIPVIVDPDGPGGKPLTLTQSGAIDLYLAEKAGRFIPAEPTRRVAAYQWLMYAVTDCAPSSTGIFFSNVLLPDKSPANVAWFEARMLRQFRVADVRLATDEWLAGELSIADLAMYPIYAVRKALIDAAGDLPNLSRWGAALAVRPGVARAMHAAD